MGVIKRYLGLDLFDVILHLVVTGSMLGFVGATGGPEGLYPMIVGGSALLLGIRRKAALKRRPAETTGENERVLDLEDRLRELEGLQDRVLELEERLDFAERMLTRGAETGARLPEAR